MKSMILAASLVALTSVAHANETYSCRGAYDDNKGTELSLSLRNKQFSLHGTAVPGEGFTASVTCQGSLAPESRNTKYDVYSTNENAACPVDYVKIMKSLKSEGSGMLVLARTSGGDTHDSSGYTYRYYRCVRS